MFLKLDKKETNKLAAIDMDGREVTYNEVVQYVERFKKEIISERTMVIILCHNDIPSLLTYLACMSNRIVPLLLSSKTDKEHIKNLIYTYHPSHICGYKEELESFNLELLIEKETIEKSGFCIAKTEFFSYPLYEELSLLLTTSGSTGSPKLVRHSYYNLEEQAKNIAAFFELTGIERPMVVLPIMYTMGLSMTNSHLYAGATLMLSEESLLSKKFWNFFKEREITSFTGVPYSFELLHRVGLSRMELPALNMLSQGGGKLSADLQKEFAEYIQKKGGRYIATYGQTEGSARMSYLPAEYALTKIGSIGKAIPNGKLYLKNDSGELITSPNTEGEMYYEGPNVTLGYAQKGEELLLADERKSVLATGDLAYFDEDGMFYITGRKKRFLKLFGHRVSLDECESILKNSLGIECACVGTDQKLIIVVTESERADDAKTLLLDKTELYPHSVEVIVIPQLPRSEAGKILYSELNNLI